MSVVAKGSTVLVTGANGYIAGHVCDQLLQAGYKVRGTVRSHEKGKWMYELFDKKYGSGQFEAVEVPDMVADGAFDSAVKGVSGICHVASVLSFSNKADEVIPPVVKGTLSVLTSATKEAGIKSFVLTSSSTAALMPVPNKEIIVTKDSWNDESVKQAYESKDPDGFVVYGASKSEGERALWKAVKQTNPPFQVASVLPNLNIGEILRPGGAMSASTGSWVPKLFQGDKEPLYFPPQWYIDVQDTARLHVAALIDPSCNGERIFGFAKPYYWNEILEILRKNFPQKQFPGDINLDKDLSKAPNEDAEALLQKHFGKTWSGLEETVLRNLAQLV
ncbi:hypothetical protein LTR78_009971 [Recurvomyces mirabilis]|uniref:NAD-dependent epimerase/dehydratase domain-containing protein n=1 Tax=Recurvomyces mirabilis TaxID=574656 RepID=A0AAE0TMZ4_9PEZI|nr:hypothetical protein LTR78_009971 [Recurvomyces mirabilis]KAK5160312.1 hypothetical protein LTS14_001324 [Recurvomyces mirabilis]